ncbi:MAG: HAD family phosphatase [Ruminococcaceae bacterium]|nr:HAD family phosphatase [Oscillospiraceae bacterium]
MKKKEYKVKESIQVIKNYIFDFGNVLAEFYPDRLTAPFVSDEETRDYISNVVFDRAYWDKLDMGTITDDEVKNDIRRRVPENLGDIACKVYDNWINTLTPVENMQQLIFDIRKTDKKLFLLSNISIGFADSYGDVGWIKELFDCFEGMVFSGVIGKVKPDGDIFEYLLDRFGLKAEECLFIDDNEKNILGAKAVGIEGYLFDGDAKKLRDFLFVEGL